MYFENALAQGWGGGYAQSVFFSTGVGGGFKNVLFGAYVLYGWLLPSFLGSNLISIQFVLNIDVQIIGVH